MSVLGISGNDAWLTPDVASERNDKIWKNALYNMVHRRKLHPAHCQTLICGMDWTSVKKKSEISLIFFFVQQTYLKKKWMYSSYERYYCKSILSLFFWLDHKLTFAIFIMWRNFVIHSIKWSHNFIISSQTFFDGMVGWDYEP